MNIYIIYRAMFNDDGTMNTIGGIENYILNLIDLFKRQGWSCHIVQPASSEFTHKEKDLTIHGVNTGILRGNLKKFALTKWVKNNADRRNDIVIFATDTYSVNMRGFKTIAIQHGISWDKPKKNKNKFLQFPGSLVNQIKYLSYINSNTTLVCVDHNFVNWYRTWFNTDNNKVKVIYNFYQEKITEIDFEKKWSELNDIKIIIARRFVDYRGIGFIAPIIKKLIESHNVSITFAGSGPLESYLHKLFNDNPKVSIIKYGPNESYSIHKDHHIAIIPTLGSEGTSLSMIEAMAAGCLVISSNVGGLSNLLINKYNGWLIMPSEKQFEYALMQSVTHLAASKSLAQNGLQTISTASSQEAWGEAWLSTIKELI
ncbi:glycosyltransferase family 4 protein [Shewanella sp. NIFS-20-20]|uniref:glycosyltransferase family 4 protein n=1 Tax=Shewanella sp. NIFS-20-20 TaxID=2853806 RepID=UPI001C4889A7|nr:glycosyltransferase family 4 protein [Shewanella sp. NIFS-20-20]MBV7316124.1 glycosyltransferase family 4 protein [Shewanella sp. NIFS-20-20]